MGRRGNRQHFCAGGFLFVVYEARIYPKLVDAGFLFFWLLDYGCRFIGLVLPIYRIGITDSSDCGYRFIGLVLPIRPIVATDLSD